MKTMCPKLLVAALAAACSLGYAGTIAAVVPTDVYGRALIAEGTGVYSAGWSQTGSYTNVSIRMALKDFGDVPEAGTVQAFLTNQIGAGTTQAANEVVAPVTVAFAAGHEGMLTLFTGLSLGPGNYYVTMTRVPSEVTFALVGEVSSPSPVLDTGVAILGYGIAIGAPSTYIPDMPQNWTFTAWAFDVTGDPVVDGVPEPSNLWLLGSGLIPLIWRMRRA
ncbi:MAG: hypothetical protein JST93_12480 [Acidobacteria bacterium]|nr:hypothetical protein [Acidobacteriota bacterium]